MKLWGSLKGDKVNSEGDESPKTATSGGKHSAKPSGIKLFTKKKRIGKNLSAKINLIKDESYSVPKKNAKEVFLSLVEVVKAYLVNVNWLLLLIAVCATLYGVVMINSTGVGSVTVQLVAMALGIVAFLILAMFDISHLAVFWKLVMVIGIGLLLSVVVLGRSAGGNAGWITINIGSFSTGFQPGEVVKIFMIITLSKHLDMIGDEITKLKNVLFITLHFGIYAAALVLSKDDGMLLTYIVLFVAITFATGIKLRYLAIGGGIVVLASPLLWNYVFDYYQKMRILVVLDPKLDLEEIGYQAYISKVAIAHGGLTGMGLGNGAVTQFAKPGVLPAKYTDFIFSVICEELGYIGAAAAILLIFAVIAICYYTAKKVRHDRFSYLLCMSVTVMLVFQTVLNTGMCMGIVPVIGLTLPFFSYGGSSILTMFVSIGMVASVGSHVRPRTLSDIY